MMCFCDFKNLQRISITVNSIIGFDPNDNFFLDGVVDRPCFQRAYILYLRPRYETFGVTLLRDQIHCNEHDDRENNERADSRANIVCYFHINSYIVTDFERNNTVINTYQRDNKVQYSILMCPMPNKRRYIIAEQYSLLYTTVYYLRKFHFVYCSMTINVFILVILCGVLFIGLYQVGLDKITIISFTHLINVFIVYRIRLIETHY